MYLNELLVQSVFKTIMKCYILHINMQYNYFSYPATLKEHPPPPLNHKLPGYLQNNGILYIMFCKHIP